MDREQNFGAFIPPSLLLKIEKEGASFKAEEFRVYEEQLRAKQSEILDEYVSEGF